LNDEINNLHRVLMTDQDELKIDVEEKQLALSPKAKIVIDARAKIEQKNS
jgi:hypothetical protein